MQRDETLGGIKGQCLTSAPGHTCPPRGRGAATRPSAAWPRPWQRPDAPGGGGGRWAVGRAPRGPRAALGVGRWVT